MRRLLANTLLLTLLGVLAAFVADYPGAVTIDWLDYRIETSLIWLLLLIIAFFLITNWCLSLLRWLFRVPSNVGGYFDERRRHKGMRLLAESASAYKRLEYKRALRLAEKAKAQLGNHPAAELLFDESKAKAAAKE